MHDVWGVPVVLESKFHKPAPCHSSVSACHGYDASLLVIKGVHGVRLVSVFNREKESLISEVLLLR